MQLKYAFIYAVLLVMLLSNSVLAATTGKISGTIRDEVTGEALIGVNVIVKDLNIGAATDVNGYFAILNVRPGVHKIQISMIGYAPLIVDDVTVIIGLTTDLHFKLKPQVLGMASVHVLSERPAVVKDLSGSQLNVSAETIEKLPVSSVENVLGLQAGVENLSVRGSSSYQTALIMDGFSMVDSRSNTPVTGISLSSVEEIQVQSGGFNAEYGNIRSGIVNIITAEGSATHYGGTFSYQYSPPAPKHYGLSPYDSRSYYLRPYLDPDVAWEGTSNGAWDDFTQRQYPSFEGWNSYADVFQQDSDSNNDLTPTGAQRIFIWKHRRPGNIIKPDYTLDFGFGGPVPIISSMSGNLRFYLSQRSVQETFVFPLSRDAYTSSSTRLKINSDLSSKIKLLVTLQYGEERSANPYNWTTVPTGSLLRGTWSVANLASKGALFTPDYFSPTTIYRGNIGLKLNHMLDAGTFYEILFQHLHTRYNTYQTENRDTMLVEIFPGHYEDEAPYGYNPNEWMNLGRDASETRMTSLRGDFTHQLNAHHQLKAGIQYNYFDYRVRSFTESAKDTWRRSLIYNVYPYRLSAYLQDKMEFEGFIANLGLRLEYASANTVTYLLSAYDPMYSQGQGDYIETQAPREKTKPILSLSPRLGIAHPITDHSKLYFNYGHFQSEVQSSYRFRLQRESNGLVTYAGNPNLEPEKTIAYELGYSHSLNNIYLLDLATYYKDVTDQPGWVSYTNANGSVSYHKAENNNYEDIRGIEFTLTKTRGDWLTGFVNYTYMVKSSGYFGLLQYYQNPQEQRDYERLNTKQFKPRPQPYWRANLALHTPSGWGPRMGALRPLADWQLSVLMNYKTGAYTTYNPNSRPGIRDNVQWRDTYRVNLRLNRLFDFGRYQLEFFADVSNLLDTRFLSSTGFSDHFDYLAYMESLNFSWEEGLEHGDDRVGDYRPDDVAYDPLESNPDHDLDIAARNRIRKANKSYIDMPNLRSLTFLSPRKITSGIRIKF